MKFYLQVLFLDLDLDFASDKGNGDSIECANYRGTSLLSVVSQLLYSDYTMLIWDSRKNLRELLKEKSLKWCERG